MEKADDHPPTDGYAAGERVRHQPGILAERQLALDLYRTINHKKDQRGRANRAGPAIDRVAERREGNVMVRW
jgi:hypothetical protein